MTKAELRKKYKVLRKDLSQNQVDDFSLAIANQLLKLDIWDTVILSYFFDYCRTKRSEYRIYFKYIIWKRQTYRDIEK